MLRWFSLLLEKFGFMMFIVPALNHVTFVDGSNGYVVCRLKFLAVQSVNLKNLGSHFADMTGMSNVAKGLFDSSLCY